MRAVFVATALLAALTTEVSAQTLACGVPVTGEISALGEVDTFLLPGQAGDVVELAVGRVPAPGFVVQAEVRAPSGLLAVFPVTLEGLRIQLAFALAETGIYQVSVGARGADATGSYSLTIQNVTGARTCGQPIQCGQDDVVGQMTVPGESDTYAFDGVAGDVVSLSVGELGITDAVRSFTVYAPSGTWLDMLGLGEEVFPLPETGVYTVVVSDNQRPGVAGYLVSLQSLTGTASCGQPIGCGQEGVAGEIGANGDTDAYAFDGVGGDVVLLSVTSDPALDLVSRFRVFTPTGMELVAAAISPTVVTLPEAGVYTVEVSDSGRDDTGPYLVSLQGLSETASCGTAIGCADGELLGELAVPGDTDAFVFDALAGDTAAFSLRALSRPLAARLSLFSPTGQLLASDASGRLVAEGLAAGRHTVVVAEDGFDVGGGYAVAICGNVAGCGDDADADGYADECDNCALTANAGQDDSGGIASPSDTQGLLADGIGDACQCGDVSGDGRVTGVDGTFIARCSVGLAPCGAAGVAALPGGPAAGLAARPPRGPRSGSRGPRWFRPSSNCSGYMKKCYRSAPASD